jgi:hypothetical protein
MRLEGLLNVQWRIADGQCCQLGCAQALKVSPGGRIGDVVGLKPLEKRKYSTEIELRDRLRHWFESYVLKGDLHDCPCSLSLEESLLFIGMLIAITMTILWRNTGKDNNAGWRIPGCDDGQGIKGKGGSS